MGMFKKPEETTTRPFISTVEQPEVVPAPKTVIGRTLFLKGEISSDEEVLVEGRIEGKIKMKDRVIIGKDGHVTADIEAREVVIKGVVNGNVRCTHKVEILPEGTLNGNIVSEKVVLAEGAIFKGNIDMSIKEDKKGAGKHHVKEETEVKSQPSEEKKEA